MGPDARRSAPWMRAGQDQWYRIIQNRDATQTDTADVYIYDEISWWGISADQFVQEINALDTGTIRLHINSPGGEIFDGLAIYNALLTHSARVNVIVDGVAASAASFIAQAGDFIEMATGTSMMIHDAIMLTIGDAADHRAGAEMLDAMSDSIAAIYAERSGVAAESWRESMVAETWYNADEAVKAGLADKVVSLRRDAENVVPRRQFDLAMFRYAGRGSAPDPALAERQSSPHRARHDRHIVNVTAALDTVCPSHSTATSDKAWEKGPNEKRLPSPVPVAKAKRFYTWYDADQVEDGAIPKSAGKLPHHEVDADGNPGAANLAGCRAALSRLPQSDIPEADHAACQTHLNGHLDDGGRTEDRAGDEIELTAADLVGVKDALDAAAGDPMAAAYDPDVLRSAITDRHRNAPVPPKVTVHSDGPTLIDPVELGEALRKALQ
jgi:ATP-dependent protease ClpP protease subunit